MAVRGQAFGRRQLDALPTRAFSLNERRSLCYPIRPHQHHRQGLESPGRFYEVALGCTPLQPDSHSQRLARRAGRTVRSSLRGINCACPDMATPAPRLKSSPTRTMPEGRSWPPTPGFAHLAFAVDDVEASVKAFVTTEPGAKPIVKEVPGVGRCRPPTPPTPGQHRGVDALGTSEDHHLRRFLSGRS
jgi:hypothetical protein